MNPLEKDNISSSRRKVLFITLEPISRQMAGPAIRAVELARCLCDEFDVTVFSPQKTNLSAASLMPVDLKCGLSKARLYELASSCEIIYLQANVLKPYPGLAGLGKYLVVDLYDPYLFSLLAQHAEDPTSSSTWYRMMHQVLEKHINVSDFAICASERQRDYWLGRFCSAGRLTPQMYKLDPSFAKVIDVVPFGLPSSPPEANGTGLRDLVAGIGKDDRVALWGGGIWEWFDPLTVIEATARLAPAHPDFKLFFMGWRSPNPQVGLMSMAHKARALAEKLDVAGKSVIFHDSWVPYEQRVNYLLDADIGVSAHFDLAETRFSFRTRVLDYLWAGLPVVTTGGDPLAGIIEKAGAGLALPFQDVDAWAAALGSILDDEKTRQSFARGSRALAREFIWGKASAPLRQFCRNPYHLPRSGKVRMPSLIERAAAVYKSGGASMVFNRSKKMIEDLF